MADDQGQQQEQGEQQTPPGQQGQQGQQPPPGETPAGNEQEQPFDAWLGQQDEAVRGRIERHTSGLVSALQSEREQRRTLERQMRTLSTQLEQGSEARTQVEQLSSQLAEQERRATFYEDAVPARVRNPKLAYIAAKEAGLIDGRSGKVNMEGLKQQYPELFEQKAPPPPGNAGAGTGGQQPAPSPNAQMNQSIRRAAGRSS